MKVLAILLLPINFITLTVGQRTTHNQLLLVGGRGYKDVQVFGLDGEELEGDCSLIPDLPFEPLNSIGLRDKDGRAMICGGNKNPNQKSCYVLDRDSNTWVRGPNMKRKRVGASATCLDSGVCWVFGGKTKSFTEYYDPETNSFKMGPAMPVNSVHGLCTAYGRNSGLIYMAARREPNTLRRFTFNLTTEEFEEVDSVENVEIRYAACGTAEHAENDDFVVVGGGATPATATNSFYVYRADDETYSATFPTSLFGAVGIFVDGLMLVAGGVTADGEYPREFYLYDPFFLEFYIIPQEDLSPLDPPRANPVAVMVEKQDCP